VALVINAWSVMSKLFDETRQYTDKIEQIERMRRDFVANVSHELRTPLTVISGYLETLAQKTNDTAYQVIYQQMLLHAKRMKTLIDDLLLLSKLESTQLNQNQTVAISKILAMIKVQAHELSAEKNHKITLKCEDILTLDGQASELKSLFSNIIFNAVKYTPEQGSIIIRWYQLKERAVFEVKDTGIGIDKKHISRITERFYRVDKARSRDSGGIGLGLAIAKHVLIRHGGHMEIESSLGQGSCFRCFFPLTEL
jgi:two-component system, OmpR family, phosphate regulon sensor histidine kinase PhoR